MNLEDLLIQAESLSTTYILVDGEVVWDYKVKQGRLYLITSPEKGTPISEYVSVNELLQYVEKEGGGNPELVREQDLDPISRIDKKIVNTEYALLKLV